MCRQALWIEFNIIMKNRKAIRHSTRSSLRRIILRQWLITNNYGLRNLPTKKTQMRFLKKTMTSLVDELTLQTKIANPKVLSNSTNQPAPWELHPIGAVPLRRDIQKTWQVRCPGLTGKKLVHVQQRKIDELCMKIISYLTRLLVKRRRSLIMEFLSTINTVRIRLMEELLHYTQVKMDQNRIAAKTKQASLGSKHITP